MIRLALSLVLMLSSPTVTVDNANPAGLPAKATINHHEWLLTAVQHLEIGEVGRTECGKHVILILSSIGKPREIADTLVHEIMHALACNDYGEANDSAWNNSGDPNDQEEGHAGIYTMTPRLVDFMVDNPELVKYIQEQGSR